MLSDFSNFSSTQNHPVCNNKMLVPIVLSRVKKNELFYRPLLPNFQYQILYKNYNPDNCKRDSQCLMNHHV